MILRNVSDPSAARKVISDVSRSTSSPDAVPASPRPTGYVGLTFDDGPNPASTSALLEALEAGGARATFFIWGEHADQYPELLRDVRSAGMWIANHAYTHPHLPQIEEASAFQEISRTQQTIQRITGTAPTLFRPPYGETNAQVTAGAQRLGLTEVLWTVDSQDWNGAGTDQIVAAAATVQPGGVILMHDGYQTTIDAIPGILAGLASRGLRPGKIVHAPADVSGDGQISHAVAVAP
jgi:endo-1,4-beta-xylanase